MITFLIYFYFLCVTLAFLACLEDIKRMDEIKVRDAFQILFVVLSPFINTYLSFWYVQSAFKGNFPKLMNFKIWKRKVK